MGEVPSGQQGARVPLSDGLAASRRVSENSSVGAAYANHNHSDTAPFAPSPWQPNPPTPCGRDWHGACFTDRRTEAHGSGGWSLESRAGGLGGQA